MTEHEWLASEDPAALLRYVIGYPDGLPGGSALPQKVSDRKLRLFAAAIYRAARGNHYPQGDAVKTAEMVERWADFGEEPPEHGLPFREYFGPDSGGPKWRLISAPSHAESALSWCRDWMLSLSAQAHLLRDVVGNPWRPWLTKRDIAPGAARMREGWLDQLRTPAVLAVAQGIYDEGRFEEMPILADALEEAGCDNEDILWHLRGVCPACYGEAEIWDVAGEDPDGMGGREVRVTCPVCEGSGKCGPHARGCWALDLILGKE